MAQACIVNRYGLWFQRLAKRGTSLGSGKDDGLTATLKPKIRLKNADNPRGCSTVILDPLNHQLNKE